ncbi:hypothetical protein [Segetibacter koreensis]|uniref:hypothetical protein n=1 Tax=Segetibacter koreensis TaxID=398037 RepID=UPI0003A18248|nr:hypothetical protein [Segetibacter koreensis]
MDKTLLAAASVLFDDVYVTAGTNSVATIEVKADAIHFLNEAFKHSKAIPASDKGRQFWKPLTSRRNYLKTIARKR